MGFKLSLARFGATPMKHLGGIDSVDTFTTLTIHVHHHTMSSMNHNHEEDEYDKMTPEDYTGAQQMGMTVSEYKEERNDFKHWLEMNHEEDEYDKMTSEDYTNADQMCLSVGEYKEKRKGYKGWSDLDEGKMKAAFPLLEHVVCMEDLLASKKRKCREIIFKKGKPPLLNSNVPSSAYSDPNPDPTIFNMVETLFTFKKTALQSITVVFTASSGEIEEHHLDSPLAWRDRNVILSKPQWSHVQPPQN
jgi:hypothetical protein